MDQSTATKLRVVVIVVLVALAGFATGLAVSIAAVAALAALGVSLSDAELLLLSPLLLQGVGFPLTAWAALRLRGRSWSFVPVRRPSWEDLKWTGGGYALAFGGVLVAGLLLQAAGAPTASRAEGDLFQDPQVLLVMIPLSVLFIGPGEELLFRGIIQGTLREVFSAPAAIGLASLTFAPAHITALVGSPRALAVTVGVLFVPSLVFGYVYERTGNILVPAITHGAYNATLFGFSYLAVRYGPDGGGAAALAEVAVRPIADALLVWPAVLP